MTKKLVSIFLFLFSSLFLASFANAEAYVYLANRDSNTLSVVRESDHILVERIAVGNYPTAVAVSPDASRVYVANSEDDTVSVIDTSNNTLIANISVGVHPFGIAVTPDASKVYVSNLYSNTVSVIRASNLSVIHTIVVGNFPSGIVAAPDGNKIFVANNADNTVSSILTNNDVVEENITVGLNPLEIAMSPDGAMMYVTNSLDNTVSAILCSSQFLTLDTIHVGNFPTGISVSPDGSYLYVVDSDDNHVTVISTSLSTVIRTVVVGSLPQGIAVSAEGERIYVNNTGENTVSVIQSSNYEIINTLSFDGDSPNSIGNFITPKARAQLSSDLLYFDQQSLHQASPTQSFSLTNTGNGLLKDIHITTSEDFSQTNDCPSNLIAGASCHISVVFTPSVYGPQHHQLSITHSASSRADIVQLEVRELDGCSLRAHLEHSILWFHPSLVGLLLVTGVFFMILRLKISKK